MSYEDKIKKQIEEVSYFKWIDAGRPSGLERFFWEAAEREVLISECLNLIPHSDEEMIEITFKPPKRKWAQYHPTYEYNTWSSSGYTYAPYVPLTQTPTVTSYGTKLGISSRGVGPSNKDYVI